MDEIMSHLAREADEAGYKVTTKERYDHLERIEKAFKFFLNPARLVDRSKLMREGDTLCLEVPMDMLELMEEMVEKGEGDV